jgi:hypothetical protein
VQQRIAHLGRGVGEPGDASAVEALGLRPAAERAAPRGDAMVPVLEVQPLALDLVDQLGQLRLDLATLPLELVEASRGSGPLERTTTSAP